MKKKEYMQPTMLVVKVQTTGMLAISSVSSTGLTGFDGYDENGGDQGLAW